MTHERNRIVVGVHVYGFSGPLIPLELNCLEWLFMQLVSTSGWFTSTMAHNMNAHLTHLPLQIPLPLSLPRVSGPPSLSFCSSLGKRETTKRDNNSKEMRMSRRNKRQIQIRERRKTGLLVALMRKTWIKRGVQEMMKRGEREGRERMVQVLDLAQPSPSVICNAYLSSKASHCRVCW